MARTSRYETISAGDDGEFVAYCAVPDRGSGPGMLLFQEIFGINDNMRAVADRLAAAGYVTVVPDMFWRVEPRFERQDEMGFFDAIAVMRKFDFALAVADIDSTFGHLLSMEECSGPVGAVGFCLGGGLAFAAATMSRVDGRGPDAAVCYYGTAVNDLLGHVDNLDCPTMFHYGNADTFIPERKIDEVERAVSGCDDIEFYRYDAGHAFSNWDAASMYNREAADLAWSRTLEFFARWLPLAV